MPYFVTDNSPDCAGFAVVKEDGAVIGCHSTQQDAIDQMVAVSLSEGIEPGGEMRVPVPGRDRYTTQQEAADRAEVIGCEGTHTMTEDEQTIYMPCSTHAAYDAATGGGGAYREARQVNLEAPAFMRAAARRGLTLNADGHGGDGLTDKTLREARAMVNGDVSEDKWRRIAPWVSRHMDNLDAPQNSDRQDAGYPGPGLVAHLLWGSGSTKRAAQRTADYAQGVVDRLDREDEDAPRSIMKGTTMIQQLERRIADFSEIEMRADTDGGPKMTFRGYAAVFNSPSEPLPFTEVIAPGAFRRSLKSRNEIKMFVNHNMDKVLASSRAGTLTLKEDDRGLLVEAQLPNTTDGRDLSVLLERGDVSSMSFGFTVPKGGDKWNDDGSERTLKQVRLHEVSVVTGFPAYEATTATVRTLAALSTRTNVDADAIADVLTKLEAGETLPNDEADLLMQVVTKLRDKSAQTESDLSALGLKRKEIDLLFKAV